MKMAKILPLNVYTFTLKQCKNITVRFSNVEASLFQNGVKTVYAVIHYFTILAVSSYVPLKNHNMDNDSFSKLS